ncbi:MAG: hypothetical protein JWP37_3773 [Mucilaginibacter sp.]|nr:hypothetical protein [Mucilaginibacter sp.]
MDWVSFGLLLNDHLPLYLGILAASIIFYTLIFKRLYLSILDPIMFAVLFSVFGFSVVWFLYFTHNIDTRYLYSYLFTQVAFWVGLFTFKSLKRSQVLSQSQTFLIEDQSLFEKILFLVTSGSYIILQLVSYRLIGIPLLLGTHIDLYNSSGGLGIIGRILDVLKPCSIFILIYFLFNKHSSIFIYIYKYVFLLMVLVFFALSGSKGEFMFLGFLIFCFLLLNASRFKSYFLKLRKLELILLIVGIGFAFLTILVQKTDTQNSLGVFLFRLVASGDTYFFAYANNNIEHVNGSQPFLALFGDMFSTLRIIPRDRQPVILGVQLFRMFSDLDITAGPNARHNVFGYVYFGFYGSIVFSYLIGLILSLVRNVLFFELRKNILGQIIFVYLYLGLAGIETDPPQAFLVLENVLLIFPVFLLISIVFYLLLTKKYNSPEINYYLNE